MSSVAYLPSKSRCGKFLNSGRHVIWGLASWFVGASGSENDVNQTHDSNSICALYADLGPWWFVLCYLQFALDYGYPGMVTIDGDVRFFAAKDAIERGTDVQYMRLCKRI